MSMANKPASAEHGTFVIERNYEASPAQVFAAWASAQAKQRWFGCNDELVQTGYSLDFRVGGSEHSNTGPKGGTRHIYEARYWDIVPDERIVFSYDMHLDERRISVSLTTIEFHATQGGTRMVFTEQGVFLDGHDTPAQREHGTGVGLENLGKYLRAAA